MRGSEIQFRNMFNDHSAVMLLVEPKSGRIREGNSAASQFYGYSVEKLKSMSMDEINTLDVNQAAVIRETVLNKEKNYFVLQHRLASGEIRDIEAYSTSIDSGGETVLFSIINDITERKEMEKELQQEKDALYKSEEKHRFLIENSHEIIYTMTVDGVFTFVSPSWTVHLGHQVKDVVGKSFQQFVHPDDLHVCLGWIQKAIRAGQRHNDIVEYRAHHLDGSWYWHISSVVPLKNGAGDVIGFEGTARDITARKQAQEALNNSFSLIEATLETIDNGILVIGQDGSVVKANTRFAEMWHIPGDVVASGNDKQLLDYILTQLSDPDAFITKIRELYSEPRIESFDFINFKDGRIFERISKPMFVAGEPQGRVWSFLDITERNRANEALQNERLLLRTLIDNIPDSIYMVDLDCRKTLANKTEVRFMGAQSEAEVLGKNDFDIYPKELAESFFADNQSVIQTGIPVINREEYIFDENKQKRWLLTSSFHYETEITRLWVW